MYSGEDTESLPFYTQRSLMMVNIIRKMRREIEDTTRSPGTRIIGQCCRSRLFLAGAGVNLFNVDCVLSLIKLLRQRGKQIWADGRSRRDFKNSKPTIKMTGSVSPVVKDVFTQSFTFLSFINEDFSIQELVTTNQCCKAWATWSQALISPLWLIIAFKSGANRAEELKSRADQKRHFATMLIMCPWTTSVAEPDDFCPDLDPK